jgi:hypothetical protein
MCIALAAALPALAQNDWVLPAKTGALNVVRDKGVDNTGKTDVTDTLNKILGTLQTPFRWIYFPKGTYLVSGMVSGYKCKAGEQSRGPVIVGESRTGTVFRLKDGVWPTANIDPSQFPPSVNSQVVLHSGDCGNTGFSKELHNFTVDIGSNNAGASGVTFNTANNGGISDVNVISRDGKGCIGLAISGGEPGPLYAHSIYVNGFKVGIYNNATDDGTLFQIRLENQTLYGIQNAWGGEIDSFSFNTSAANVPAVFSGSLGRLVAINCFLAGNSTGAAIVNQGGHLFARDIHSTGYQGGALSSTGTRVSAPSGATLDEYASHGSIGLWYTPGKSLNLPVKYPPFPPWEQDTAKWASTAQFKGGGLGQPSRADSTAFRMAWTSGRSNIEISNTTSQNLTDTLFVDGNKARVLGTKGAISGPAIVIQNNTPPVVVLQYLEYSGPIFNRSSKTVIFESVNNGSIVCDGPGETYINGLMGRIIVRNPAARVWLRDLNAEGVGNNELPHDTATAVVYDGVLWVLGCKSENFYSRGNCFGGYFEMLGFLNYNFTPDQNEALFNVSGDGQFCLAVMTTVSHGGTPFNNLVFETRGGVMKKLTRIVTNPPGTMVDPDGGNLTLYTGYNKVPAATQRPLVNARTMPDRFGAALLYGTTLEAGFTLSRPQPVSVRLIDMRGRAITVESGVFGAGAHQRRYNLSGIASGAYCVEIKTADAAHTQRVLLTGTDNR